MDELSERLAAVRERLNTGYEKLRLMWEQAESELSSLNLPVAATVRIPKKTMVGVLVTPLTGGATLSLSGKTIYYRSSDNAQERPILGCPLEIRRGALVALPLLYQQVLAIAEEQGRSIEAALTVCPTSAIPESTRRGER